MERSFHTLLRISSKMVGPPKQFDEDKALLAALQVFWAKGYEATSISDLVGAMGINRSSMYATFGDKDALFRTALRRYQELSVVGLAKDLGGRGSLRQRVARAITNRIESTKAMGADGCMCLRAMSECGPSDPEISKLTLSMYGRVHRMLQDALDEGVVRGELCEEADTAALANILMVFTNGLPMLNHTGLTERTKKGVHGGFLDLLLPTPKSVRPF